MTMAEKSLARASGKKEVRPGEIVEANIDWGMIHEGTGPLTVRAFRELGLKRVWDPDKVIIILDHYAPAGNEIVAGLHKMLREFAADYGIRHFYNINEGICHQVMPEKGHILPGEVFVGTDSHTCTGGAFGCFATGIGSTEMAGVFATGKLWFRVPESYKFIYYGKLPPFATAKDAVLQTIGRVTAEGANYKSVEFTGPAIEAMSVGERMVMANMTIEMGGKVGLIAPDEKTIAWLKARTQRPFQVALPDPDAAYELTLEFEVSHLEPLVACPNSVDKVVPVSQIEGTRFDQAFVGTCTNGRLQDLREAAAILRGKRISPKIRMIVTPASREVYLEALREGLVEVFVEAGAVVTNPNCGPCCGNHEGILGEGEVCLSTMNRNFRGRMGKGGQIYLASPSVVAASALLGEIVHPARVLQEVPAR